jgi:15-cis-phytoene synthase
VTLEACAALLERGDPDRFAAVMAAPVDARAALLPLYALNLEVARAPWVTKEAMIAEMRLQWWRDVVADAAQGRTRAHEVAGPLATLIRQQDLPVAVIDRLIAARRWDIYSDPFEDRAAFDAYLEDTGAGLMWLSARALGAPDDCEPACRGFGWAVGLSAYLRAVPDLEARGRFPLVDGRAEAVAMLATDGVQRIAAARAGLRRLPKGARAALIAGWQAEAVLKQAARQPWRVAEGALGLSEFARRGLLLWQALRLR